MRQPSENRRSRGSTTERLTVRGLAGTVGVFGALLVALSAPLLVAGAVGAVVAAVVVGRVVAAVRWRPPDTGVTLQFRVPLTDLSVRI